MVLSLLFSSTSIHIQWLSSKTDVNQHKTKQRSVRDQQEPVELGHQPDQEDLEPCSPRVSSLSLPTTFEGLSISLASNQDKEGQNHLHDFSGTNI